MYVLTSELPDALQKALSAVGYKKKDVSITVKEKESLIAGGGKGMRAFSVLVNLLTGEHEIIRGSWGGANIFNQTNQVDLNDKMYDIPENGAVIKGYEGNGIQAGITISSKNVVKNLLPEVTELTEEELRALSYFRYKSGYKKELLKGKDDIVEKLIHLGYVVKNKAGATTLSLKGKNAVEGIILS